MSEYEPACTKNYAAVLSFLLTLILMTGSVSAQNASLKAVHLSPGADAVDIFVDGERAAGSIGFGESTGSIQLEAGEHEISIVPAGADAGDAETSTSLNFQKDRSYIVVARNYGSFMEVDALNTSRTTPASKKARLRMAHFSPDLLEVDILIENSNSYSTNSMAYRETSNYISTTPGNYTITVKNSRNIREIFTDDISVHNGRIYTAFVSGTSSRGFQIVLLTERAPETRNGGDEDGEEEVIIAQCRVISEEPRRLDCRVFD